MKRLTRLATLFMLGLSAAGMARANEKAAAGRGLVGSWEGPLKVTPQIELRIILEVEKSKSGSLTAKLASPDEGLKDLPIASIALEADVVTFDLRVTGATYKGKLNRDGTEITGEWTQRGSSFPLTLKRFDPSKVVAAVIPKELEGIWLGKLTAGGGIEVRLALKVEKGKDGALKAVLASPDQGVNSIPISSISLKDGALTFESKVIGASFNGKRNKDGTAFEGTFHQHGANLPLTLKKTDKIKEANRPQTPKPPFPYRSEDVAYENESGKTKLAGTLTIPPGSGPFPAVILISGSGPQDRDETILEHKPFLVIADYLSRRGIAVLRVDDRGVGGSTGSISSSTSEDFAGDVLAGIELLKKRGQIDSKKIGLIGHSEGGIIAPIAAARSRDVAYIVLMAGTGVPGAEILEAQGELILKATGAKESELKLQRRIQRQLFGIMTEKQDPKATSAKLVAALKELRDSLPESEKKALGEAEGALSESTLKQIDNAWFRFFLTYDPRPTLRKVRCPVLAINGEKDLQVPCKQNLAEISKALQAGGNRRVKTVEVPGVNHLFQPCKTGAPSEYAAIETTFTPEALKAIGDWIAEQTAEK
jgi:pimeloyl-ACP methyl ester carboxylesterase